MESFIELIAIVLCITFSGILIGASTRFFLTNWWDIQYEFFYLIDVMKEKWPKTRAYRYIMLTKTLGGPLVDTRWRMKEADIFVVVVESTINKVKYQLIFDNNNSAEPATFDLSKTSFLDLYEELPEGFIIDDQQDNFPITEFSWSGSLSAASMRMSPTTPEPSSWFTPSGGTITFSANTVADTYATLIAGGPSPVALQPIELEPNPGLDGYNSEYFDDLESANEEDEDDTSGLN